MAAFFTHEAFALHKHHGEAVIRPAGTRGGGCVTTESIPWQLKNTRAIFGASSLRQKYIHGMVTLPFYKTFTLHTSTQHVEASLTDSTTASLDQLLQAPWELPL